MESSTDNLSDKNNFSSTPTLDEKPAPDISDFTPEMIDQLLNDDNDEADLAPSILHSPGPDILYTIPRKKSKIEPKQTNFLQRTSSHSATFRHTADCQSQQATKLSRKRKHTSSEIVKVKNCDGLSQDNFPALEERLKIQKQRENEFLNLQNSEKAKTNPRYIHYLKYSLLPALNQWKLKTFRKGDTGKYGTYKITNPNFPGSFLVVSPEQITATRDHSKPPLTDQSVQTDFQVPIRELQLKVSGLQDEIDRLQRTLANEKEKYSIRNHQYQSQKLEINSLRTRLDKAPKPYQIINAQKHNQRMEMRYDMRRAECLTLLNTLDNKTHKKLKTALKVMLNDFSASDWEEYRNDSLMNLSKGNLPTYLGKNFFPTGEEDESDEEYRNLKLPSIIKNS